MSEFSYYHNGAAAGDAIEAPYSSELYTKVESLLNSSGESVVFPLNSKIATYTSELLCTRSGAGVIRVQTGAAMVGGILFTNSANVDLNIVANNSIYARMDRVIIRVDWTAQTARVAIKTGRPALLPEPPELTQIVGDVYEMSLCRYYLASGATDVAFANETSLLDERVFAYTPHNASIYTNENHFPNSEMMSNGSTGALMTATTAIPAMWEFAGTPTVAAAIKFSDQCRGMALTATVTNADYLHFDLEFAPNTFPVCTIQMQVEVLSGTLRIGYGATVLKYVDVTNGPTTIVIRTAVGVGFELRLSSAGTCQFKLGQITVTQGSIPAAFGTVHETILFGNRSLVDVVTPANGSNLRTDNDFKGTQAILGQLWVSDTSSSTSNTCYVSIQDTLGSCDQLRAEIGRRTNSYESLNHGIIGLLPSSLSDPFADYQFNYQAAIIGTMTASLYRVGIIT